MEIPRSLKIGAIVISGIAFAFFAGYVIFSYFSKDSAVTPQNEQTTEAPVNIEPESEGIEPIGSVAGVTNDSDSSGISSTPGNTGSTSNQNSLKGGVLGESTAEHEGIVPTYGNVQRTTITKEDREEYKKKERTVIYEEAEDDNDDSEITLYEYPSINEEDDYTEYTYTFEFNDDAQNRYEDGFDYTIEADSCDDDDYFTSSKYDLSGSIDDVDDEVEITIRIKNKYLDDGDDFEDGEWKFDGEKFVARGDLQVPQCED